MKILDLGKEHEGGVCLSLEDEKGFFVRSPGRKEPLLIASVLFFPLLFLCFAMAFIVILKTAFIEPSCSVFFWCIALGIFILILLFMFVHIQGILFSFQANLYKNRYIFKFGLIRWGFSSSPEEIKIVISPLFSDEDGDEVWGYKATLFSVRKTFGGISIPFPLSPYLSLEASVRHFKKHYGFKNGFKKKLNFQMFFLRSGTILRFFPIRSIYRRGSNPMCLFSF